MESRADLHTAHLRIGHLALHPDGGTIALSLFHNSLTAGFAVVNVDGTGQNGQEVAACS
jgi:hypothetical protein